jgi:phage terminase large subunit-like protein
MGWDLSCPDWERRLALGQSLVPILPLWDEQANAAVRIFDKLRLSDVIGQPRLADACGDWFRDIVRAVFGSLDPVTKQRMIRELLLLVPKKNSKTSYGALLMLVALLLNERPQATMIMTAPVQSTAEMAFDQIAGAIEADDVLLKKLHIRYHLKTIEHRVTKATLEIMTFDPAVVTGQKCHAVLIDELHALSKFSKADSALRQLRGGMMPFPEAFLLFTTTQSEEQPAGVFANELQNARDIRDGKIGGVLLPVLYEFPVALQQTPEYWENPENWHLVTPNLGRSLSLERLIEDRDAEKRKGDKEYRTWATQHLNVQIGVAIKIAAWNGATYWERCKTAEKLSGKAGLAELLRRSEVVVAGLDGGGNDDMFGLCIMGRDEKSKKWLVWAHAWIQRSVLELRQSEAQTFLDFESDGDLTIIDLPGQDIDDIVEIIIEVEATELLDRIGVDQAGIQDVVTALVDEADIELERIVAVPQGWKLVGTIKTTERRLKSNGIEHFGTRLMNFCLSNARAEPRGNAVIITKQAAGTAKIDPLMAMFNCSALMGMDPKPRKKKFQFFVLGG